MQALALGTGVARLGFSNGGQRPGEPKARNRASLVGVQAVKMADELRRRDALSFGFYNLFSQVFQGLWNKEEAMAEEASCSLITTPSGLSYCDKLLGYGAPASQGQRIKAHYVGKLENGQVFDSSYDRGRPLIFRVGVGEVIKGWDQGIVGGDGIPPMLGGGKRILKIPPQLGYGSRGAGCRGGSCVIPPDSVLLFDVEFIGKA
ncbi:hypothetical protein AMTRI_Chr02g256280 [Amborella trichopoda]